MNRKRRRRLKFKVVCRDETLGGAAFNYVMPIAHGDLNDLTFGDLSQGFQINNSKDWAVYVSGQLTCCEHISSQ
jgi:hypothetical protein